MWILAKFAFFNPAFPSKEQQFLFFSSAIPTVNRLFAIFSSAFPNYKLPICNSFFNYPKNINAFIFYYFHQNLHRIPRDSLVNSNIRVLTNFDAIRCDM